MRTIKKPRSQPIYRLYCQICQDQDICGYHSKLECPTLQTVRWLCCFDKEYYKRLKDFLLHRESVVKEEFA